MPYIEAAFEKVFNLKVKVKVGLQAPTSVERQTSNSSTTKLQREKTTNQYDHIQSWQVGDLIIHETFGTGQITHVFGSGHKISIAIKFPSGQKILDPGRASIRRIESESF